MPLTTRTTVVPLGGWGKGLNREVFELQALTDETPDCLNVAFGLRGEFARRDGYARWDTGVETTTQKIIPYEPGSGADRIIVIEEDGGVWDGTTSALSVAAPVLGAHTNRRNWQIEAAQLDDDLYLFSLRGNTWRWDGTSWVEITTQILDEDGTHVSPEAPKATTAIAHNNRIYAGNTVHDGGAHRSRINFSNPSVVFGETAGDVGGDRWGALDWVDVDPDDGTEVTKLVSFQSNILIFKDHTMHLLGGVDGDSHTLYKVADDVGCSSPQSVAQDENSVFFLDRFKGVFVFDGSQAQRVDQQIHSYLMDGMNLNKAWKAKGFFADSKYYLSVPWGSDTYNSRLFVLDTRTGTWAEYDYGVYDHAWWSESQYTVGNNNLPGVLKFEQGDGTDAGIDIDWYLETVWFPPSTSQGMGRYRLRRADLWCEADSGALTIELFVDGVETAVWTQAITASTNRINMPAYANLFEFLKLKISGTSANTTILNYNLKLSERIAHTSYTAVVEPNAGAHVPLDVNGDLVYTAFFQNAAGGAEILAPTTVPLDQAISMISIPVDASTVEVQFRKTGPGNHVLKMDLASDDGGQAWSIATGFEGLVVGLELDDISAPYAGVELRAKIVTPGGVHFTDWVDFTISHVAPPPVLPPVAQPPVITGGTIGNCITLRLGSFAVWSDVVSEAGTDTTFDLRADLAPPAGTTWDDLADVTFVSIADSAGTTVARLYKQSSSRWAVDDGQGAFGSDGLMPAWAHSERRQIRFVFDGAGGVVTYYRDPLNVVDERLPLTDDAQWNLVTTGDLLGAGLFDVAQMAVGGTFVPAIDATWNGEYFGHAIYVDGTLVAAVNDLSVLSIGASPTYPFTDDVSLATEIYLEDELTICIVVSY